MIDHPMRDTQVSLEKEISEVTIHRYYREHERAAEFNLFGDTHVARNLIDVVLSDFIDRVEEWTDSKVNGVAGRRPRAVTMITEFDDTKTMCYLFLKHMFHFVHIYETKLKTNKARRSTVLLKVTNAIHDELRMRFFRDNRKALFRQIIKDHNERDLPRNRRRNLMIREFHKQSLEWRAEGWGQNERLNLGLVLLDLLKGVAPLFHEVSETLDKKTHIYLVVNPEYATAIQEKMAKASNMFTVFYPTIIPPKPWVNDTLIGGGYYTDNIVPYRLIKGASFKLIAELENRDMTPILRAVNAIQETPWRVNSEIVDAVEFAFENDLGVSGIPLSNPEEFPPRPLGFGEDEKITNDYKHVCYMVRDRNRRAISKRLSTMRTISLARKFAEYPSIYFPHDLDFRGRAYPRPPFLNPQGPDYSKSMLEFAEGKPIETEEHAAYLAVAIANAWGQDKLPLQERVNWVNDNEEMLLSVAQNWREDLRWTQADEPFMALRGALEWAALAAYGPGFVSHMPVHFDATCSGLQHFSALLRDAEGGFHVNLTSYPERQDIYDAVAKKAQASIEELVDDEEYGTLARAALEVGITRSLCKRPVMIVPYSGTFKAAMKYINDYYSDLTGPLPMDEVTVARRLVPFVTTHVWAAISNTVIAAREAMDWITKATRIASKEDPKTPIQWETPDGFLCRQAIWDTKDTRIATYLDGQGRVRVTLQDNLTTLDSRKMAQSLSPNYIHSLDATHLRMSIIRGLDTGITNFAMIHDSFGVHASDMPRFVNECIKPAFIDMYREGTNLEKFKTELMTNITDENLIDPLPGKGSLDIEDVMGSEFFFS